MSGATPHTVLYLARHCDVENPGNVLYGHLPGFGLSEKGRRQSAALGKYFEDQPISAIFASPLQRAQETARAIAEARRNGPLEITTTSELIEAHFALYLQGVPRKLVPLRRPLWMIHLAKPGLLPSDESVEAMASRINGVIEQFLVEHPGEGAVFVSHGDPIQAFWIKAQRRPDAALHILQCAKGGFLRLEYDGTFLESLEYHPPTELLLDDHPDSNPSQTGDTASTREDQAAPAGK